MDIGSAVELARDLSIFVAAAFAAYGIDAWRREHVGKRQIDLAEQTLALFYEAREVLSYVRSPASFSHERQDLEKRPNETEAQFKFRQDASVAFYRLDQNHELFSNLHSLRYRFMASFGEEKAAPFDEIWAARNKVITAARLLARYWPEERFRTKEQESKHFERIQKQEDIFWEGSADDDEIKRKVDEAVVQMDATCRAIIEGKGTLFGILNRKV